MNKVNLRSKRDIENVLGQKNNPFANCVYLEGPSGIQKERKAMFSSHVERLFVRVMISCKVGSIFDTVLCKARRPGVLGNKILTCALG